MKTNMFCKENIHKIEFKKERKGQVLILQKERRKRKVKKLKLNVYLPLKNNQRQSMRQLQSFKKILGVLSQGNIFVSLEW